MAVSPRRARTKRTYNLSTAAVETVRGMVEQAVAPTQDAVVELAISELARRRREVADAEAWERASRDREFQNELRTIDREFAKADAETWPPE